MSQASQPNSDESGEDDWLEDFADRPVEDLRKDVGLCQADKDQANKLDEIEHDRLKQANALRQKFFYFGVGITIGCVVTSCFVSIALVFRGEMTPGIATVFITGLTVEVIGIIAIIAKYLFPENQPN